mmetsp:Transcript_22807/g.25743  ORF Transcript_22807/g.25743 Transcript_22807/m.25743 type:complete len:86 (+) Transcript_22807:127-384(+)
MQRETQTGGGGIYGFLFSHRENEKNDEDEIETNTERMREKTIPCLEFLNSLAYYKLPPFSDAIFLLFVVFFFSFLSTEYENDDTD